MNYYLRNKSYPERIVKVTSLPDSSGVTITTSFFIDADMYSQYEDSPDIQKLDIDSSGAFLHMDLPTYEQLTDLLTNLREQL